MEIYLHSPMHFHGIVLKHRDMFTFNLPSVVLVKKVLSIILLCPKIYHIIGKYFSCFLV